MRTSFKRTSRRTVVAALAAVAMSLAACSGEASQDAEEQESVDASVGEYSLGQAEAIPAGLIQEIQDKGFITVGVKYDQPLIGQMNTATGEVEGFDAEIARLLATYIFGEVTEGDDGNLRFVETTSQNRETYINDGTVDVVIASYSMYPERLTQFDFAGPYFETGQNVMVAADNTDIQSVADLAGRDVCIAEGSGSIANLEAANPEANITPLADYAACALALENGQTEAVSTDETILYGFTVDKPDAYRVLDSANIFTDEPYGVAMPLGETDARNFVNDMIDAIIANGDWQKAFDKTFGAAGMPTPEALPEPNRY
ncbi:glutamate ABC transporter substrate-binding protein [Glycomyces algeriensis]|uniref:Glutamate-binding protein n=1 Tax=Glycomyces algeriensis TaxID=256037 RepID=A0A9W6LGT8_9ACTN|nr:glutamate ABC transporter substrate-binding protein [Glycomyces algeriensis]MDA1365109.1 glutamate ABC transporter substrate-binding protein [Glycomyces algeriensis]MDR7349829.1 glutamate transport system substrate-binding protein [Glycomyces algeriensis]GLI42540.1 glutamate-binding protein [Glycomyces algeriensis]